MKTLKNSIAFRGKLQEWIKIWKNYVQLDTEKDIMKQLNDLL